MQSDWVSLVGRDTPMSASRSGHCSPQGVSRGELPIASAAWVVDGAFVNVAGTDLHDFSDMRTERRPGAPSHSPGGWGSECVAHTPTTPTAPATRHDIHFKDGGLSLSQSI